MLGEHRDVRTFTDRRSPEVEQILAWMDAHRAATGDWPNPKSGQVTGTDETWARIQDSLLAGRRGHASSSSLAKLLAVHSRVPYLTDLPTIRVERTLAWMDAH